MRTNGQYARVPSEGTGVALLLAPRLERNLLCIFVLKPRIFVPLPRIVAGFGLGECLKLLFPFKFAIMSDRKSVV